jgi:type I restriction enzyme S subunit
VNAVLETKRHQKTGIAAFDDLPDHWGLSKLGFESWVRARLGWKGLKAEEYVDEGFVFLATPNIKPREIDFENVNYITKERYDESPEIKLRAGDVLLAKDGSTLGTVNCIRSLPRAATVNSSIAVITSQRQNSGLYIYYLFQSRPWTDLIAQLKGGMGVPHLFQSDLTKFPIPLPPPTEQSQIAAGLERETARIDALIEKKTRFFELLKEKRQALITQAVTKGLDPTVPMKDSGVEWIGEVPAHWEVGALKRFWSVTDCKHITATFVEDGIPLASIREVQATYVDLSNAKKTTDKFYKLLIEGGRKPLSGDIVYSRNATVGEAAMVSDEHDSFAMGQDVCLLRHLGEQDTRFMHYQLRSGVVLDQLEVLMVGATFRRVNVDNIRNYIVCAPPPEEQAQIAEHLGGRISRLDSLMEKSALSMQLLQERRSALITAAVTGQIDLRGEAA